MISGDDIKAMDDCGYTSPRCYQGNSLLGFLNLIKALEGHIEQSKRSVADVPVWPYSGANR